MAKAKSQSKHTPHHSHLMLSDMQFGKKVKKDPGDQKTAAFEGANKTKTMSIDKPKLPAAPKRHPHRRHAGARSKRAR